MKLTKNEWLRSAGRQMRPSLGVVFLTAMGLLGIALVQAACAQTLSTTTVQGTLYLANGRAGSGTLRVSWPTFTTANGLAVIADNTTVTIGADGFVSVNLAPNLGATPAGLYYTAVFYLSDGTTSTQYWVVPSAAQASLAQVQSQVMPAAQAVQAVNKAYVDQSIAAASQSQLTASGGTLNGPLYLSADPTQAMQAADKHYVDTAVSQSVPMTGGAATGPLTAVKLGAAYQVDQFPGADFGAKLQACLSAVSAAFGGTCDARNFNGTLAMGSDLTIATGNTTIELPCATIATAKQLIVTAGTRNLALRGCALRGGTEASGSQGGTVFAYSGSSAMVRVGDPTYAMDTQGFHMDDVVINTTTATDATAQGLVAYRTQEMDLVSLYFLGNTNQTGMTLDGTGNYTGGTFYDNALNGYQTAVNAIGHQVSNSATTDWMNASTFVRLHINCPTSGGIPIAGTYGINLQQGDGNTFTGGDVEGCSTALHLGANAQNNTIVGLRNENSSSQVVADAGSSYNNWMTGGTMFTGKLTDNGTRNSFLDTFHRSFNGMNGDWYGSQQDATVTNHYRIGTGAGNERGLLDRFQTDYGYRWTTGLSDATAGEQFYQVLDELNNVYRLSIGQYNNGQPGTNNQTVINAAGTGAVVLNGSNNAGTGGVVIGSGGSGSSTVATINSAGNAQFNGALQVGGASTFAGSTTVKNQADAEIDQVLWAGATASQKESLTYKDWNGNSQWYAMKDANNNWALNSATGGLDSFKAYQNTNSGDTYVNASNASGVVRVNYETGAGSAFKIYGGSSNLLYASLSGASSIQFPGLAAGSGHNCVQIDDAGYLSNTGLACGSGSGGSGTVNAANSGQIAYYTGNGTSIGGMSAVPVTAGGTGSATASGALQNLGGISSTVSSQQTLSGPLAGTSATFSGTVTGQKIGATYQADQFTGADASVKINGCIAAVIATGGGTCDARSLSGTQAMSQEIDVGSTTQVAASIGVDLILPNTGTWTWSGITNGTSCAIKQFSSTRIIGSNAAAQGTRLNITAANGSIMDSLYCTDPASVNGSYIRAEGFSATNSGTSVLTSSTYHIQKVVDQSDFNHLYGSNSNGDTWHLENVCCGTSFKFLSGFTNAQTGGVPLVIGSNELGLNATITSGSATITTPGCGFSKRAAMNSYLIVGPGIPAGATVATWNSCHSITISAAATASSTSTVTLRDPAFGGNVGGIMAISIEDSTFNAPGQYEPNILIANYGPTAGVTLKNVYLEPVSWSGTTPAIYQDTYACGIQYVGVTDASSTAGKYTIENHSSLGGSAGVCPWSVSGLVSSYGINDVTNGTIVKPYGSAPYSGIPFYSPSGIALVNPTVNNIPLPISAMTFTPTAGNVGWYRIISTANAVSAGKVRIYSGYYDNNYAGLTFTYAKAGYSLPGEINLLQFQPYGSLISQIRVSDGGDNHVYVDVYVSTATTPSPITVIFEDNSGNPVTDALLATPTYGVAAGAGTVYTIATATGLVTSGAASGSSFAIGSNTVIPAAVTGFHGTSGTKVQLSDGTGASGVCFFAPDGSCTATAGALQNGTTVTTQTPDDNSGKAASTAYVKSPGAITPTTVTASGIITGGNDTTRTTATTIGTTGFTSTGLVLPTVPVNTTKNGRCIVLWQMSSTSYTATFGIGMSNAPTSLWGGTSVSYAAAGTSNWLAFTQTAATATAISAATTAGATGTTYRAEINFALQTGATNPVAVTLYGEVSNASATLTIQPGSACYWLP